MTPYKESPEQMLVRVRETYASAMNKTCRVTEEIVHRNSGNVGTILRESVIYPPSRDCFRGMESDILRLINHLAAENAEYREALEEGTRRLYCATKPTRGCIPDFGMTEKECDDLAAVFKQALASRGWRGEVG